MRTLVRLWPAPWRALLRLSARGPLPRSIYRAAASAGLAQQLFPDGIKLPCGNGEITVPPEVGADYAHFEPVSQRAFVEALRPGMTVLDVGANVGWYTLLAAERVGATGKVHAVEPCEPNAVLLEANVRSRGLANVEVHRWAAGETRRPRAFHVTDSSIDHGFYRHPVAPTLRTIEVTEMPVDQAIEAPIQVAKIDVEGGEIEVLNGMRALLGASGPLSLFVEWSPRCMKNAGHEASELPAKLAELGFEDIVVLDDLGRRRRALPEVLAAMRAGTLGPDWYGNVLAVR